MAQSKLWTTVDARGKVPCAHGIMGHCRLQVPKPTPESSSCGSCWNTSGTRNSSRLCSSCRSFCSGVPARHACQRRAWLLTMAPHR